MSVLEIAGSVLAGLVGLAVVFVLVMAAMKQTGRDALAVLGVRVADALVRYFERWLSKQSVERRAMERINRTLPW